MFKIQYISDVHNQFNLLKRDPSADVLVVAGDWFDGLYNLDILLKWPVPVIYVAGNHELYGYDSESIMDDITRKTSATNIHFLNHNILEFDGVRFIGCSGWTDIVDNHPWFIARSIKIISDYRRIGGTRWFEYKSNVAYFNSEIAKLKTPIYGNDECIHPIIVNYKYQQARTFIENSLSIPFDGPTVVVTHHPPSPVALRHAGVWLPEPTPEMDFTLLHKYFPDTSWHRLGTYAGRMDDIIIKNKPDLWIHGHLHQRMNYFIGSTPVMVNALGHKRKDRQVPAVVDIHQIPWWEKRVSATKLLTGHARWLSDWVLGALSNPSIDIQIWAPHAWRLHVDASLEYARLTNSLPSLPENPQPLNKFFWLEVTKKVVSKASLFS